MNETVTEWDEGLGMTLRLHKGDRSAPPFRAASFRYEFRPTAEAAVCEIHTALTYVLPGGPLGLLVDRLFMRRMFQRNVVDTAGCLAENYRTDQPIDPNRLTELRQNAL